MVNGKKLKAVSSSDDQVTQAAPVLPLTRPEDVFASLPRRAKPKTLGEMDAGCSPKHPDAALAIDANQIVRDHHLEVNTIRIRKLVTVKLPGLPFCARRSTSSSLRWWFRQCGILRS